MGGGKSVPTRYSALAQPQKILLTISPSSGIKLVTKKIKQKLMCMLLKKYIMVKLKNVT
jgi:hypothetical protein